jgi:hypothetical protein
MTYKIGDWVQSAPNSDDIRLMKRIWMAQIYKVKPAKSAPDGVCYETLGWWSGESFKRRPKLRQLWSDHLTLKTE